LAKTPNIVQASALGRRERNEDRVGHWVGAGTALLAVADGLGGHSHGELAAQMAIDMLGAAFQRSAQSRLPEPARFLSESFGAIHGAIVEEARRRRLPDNPRTVLAACVVQDGHVFAAHVGDCRFYLLRQGRIVVRSRDHTVVQRLVDEGRIREEAVPSHPYRNRLLHCLGGIETPPVAPSPPVRLADGDLILLCSDGFWGPLPPRQMMHALLARPLGEAIPELVALAEKQAGFDCDNISVVAMTWNQPG
jgi:serine/threonine protein phosphatase PrpC